MHYSNHLTPLLEVRNVTRAFPGALALDDVSFSVRAGEVRALAGENGAGKSTLMKLIAGLDRPDRGQILLDGVPVHLRSPHDALQRGISMIHQELMPFPDLTVAENLLMGREPVRFGAWVRRAAMRRESRRLLERVGAPFDPDQPMRELSVAGMQAVEIARALGYGSRLLIMDEPTSALADREVERLLDLVGELRRQGVAVIYISHRMPEIFRIADSITVLRDGRHVFTQPAETLDEEQLIRAMAGRTFDAAVAPAPPREEPVLEVRGLTRANAFSQVSFTVAAGEILGIAGLMGAGRSALLSGIFGLLAADSGEVRVRGRRTRIRAPGDALAAGIAMVTEDRKASGLVPKMSVCANMTLASLRRFCRGIFVDGSRERREAAAQARALAIKAASLDTSVERLSGGNQQKIVLAKALMTGPAVLLLDEPTRGIDVGAKAEIYAILRTLASEGKAIVMASSELNEILALSHRVLVMREGRVAAELSTRATTAEEVLRHAMPQ